MSKSIMKPRRKARLPAAPPMEPRHRRTLIVFADGARARFFEPSEDTRTLVSAQPAHMIAPKSRRPTRDIVTDRAGRAFSSAGGGIRHALEPRHDYRKLEKHNFTAALAEALDEACGRGDFDRLVVVAPRRSLGELRALLSPQARKSVSHEIAKDLTAATPTVLQRTLGSSLRATAVSRALS